MRSPLISLTACPATLFCPILSSAQAANLTSALDQHNLTYTLLLPSNASFAALETDQGLSVDMLLNNSALRSVLLYHVYTGGAIANLTVNTVRLL